MDTAQWVPRHRFGLAFAGTFEEGPEHVGPPRRFPSSPFTRYFRLKVQEVNLTAIPKAAVTHIQKTAPGPPEAIAVATPAMFPVPMVALSAVERASKWLICPSSSGLS